MAEMIEESQGLESTTVGIYRTATVVKGGRRFSFAAMVVVGDRRGSVGIGYAKSNGVPTAIEKAQKDAKKNLTKITLKGGTIPHIVTGKFGASLVRLIPAAPGSGVKAGGTVRAVLEMAGIHDCLSKAYGSTNQKNLCKATIEGLNRLRSREAIVGVRGVEIESTLVDEILAAGQRYAPQKAAAAAKTKGPVNTVGQKTGGKGGRGGPRGGRGGRREDEAGGAAATSTEVAGAATPIAPAGDAPAANA